MSNGYNIKIKVAKLNRESGFMVIFFATNAQIFTDENETICTSVAKTF